MGGGGGGSGKKTSTPSLKSIELFNHKVTNWTITECEKDFIHLHKNIPRLLLGKSNGTELNRSPKKQKQIFF